MRWWGGEAGRWGLRKGIGMGENIGEETSKHRLVSGDDTKHLPTSSNSKRRKMTEIMTTDSSKANWSPKHLRGPPPATQDTPFKHPPSIRRPALDSTLHTTVVTTIILRRNDPTVLSPQSAGPDFMGTSQLQIFTGLRSEPLND